MVAAVLQCGGARITIIPTDVTLPVNVGILVAGVVSFAVVSNQTVAPSSLQYLAFSFSVDWCYEHQTREMSFFLADCYRNRMIHVYSPRGCSCKGIKACPKGVLSKGITAYP